MCQSLMYRLFTPRGEELGSSLLPSSFIKQSKKQSQVVIPDEWRWKRQESPVLTLLLQLWCPYLYSSGNGLSCCHGR